MLQWTFGLLLLVAITVTATVTVDDHLARPERGQILLFKWTFGLFVTSGCSLRLFFVAVLVKCPGKVLTARFFPFSPIRALVLFLVF